MGRKKDIFDRLMELPGLRVFQPIYRKYREALLYIFFGGLTFLVGIVTFWLFHIVVRMGALAANIVSWAIAVMFAFLTNRIWVFEAHTKTVPEFFSQMWKFFGGRVATLVVEEVILFLFITKLGMGSMAVKAAAQVVVVVLNYVISKLVIFKG